MSATRPVAAALLMREHARIVQRVGMFGGGVEDAPIQLLRFGKLLVLLQQDGDRDRLVERQLRGVSESLHGDAGPGCATTRLDGLVGLEVVLELKSPHRATRRVFAALYSRSTFANVRVTFSEVGWPAAPAMSDAGDDDVIQLDDEVLLLAFAGLSMGDDRVLEVRPRGARLQEQGRRLVEIVDDRKVMEGRLACTASATTGTP